MKPSSLIFLALYLSCKILSFPSSKGTWGCVPEDAAVIHDMGTVSSGAVVNSGGSGGKAGGAVSDGEVVPALEHGMDWVCSAGWLSRGKVFSLVAHLCSKVDQTCV